MRIQNNKWNEVKFWDWFLLLITLVMLICGLSTKAEASGCPDSYACAHYYEHSHWDHHNLKGHWLLDPGVKGDSTGKTGDFENWAGAMGGCTDCPVGWGCDCTTSGGDINQETTFIYQGNSSAALDTGGAFYSVLYFLHTFEANKAYQVSYKYRSADGTEDAALLASNMTLTETYNFATNAWTAPVTSKTFTDVPTSQVSDSVYIATGTVQKSSYLIAFVTSTADGTKFYVDDVQIRELRNVGIVGQLGNVLIPGLNSDPVWGDSKVLLPRVGGGPAGNWGMQLDGVDDYVFCADADCEMDPTLWDTGGSFTVGCRMMADTLAASTLISKYGAAGQRSWRIVSSAGDILVYLSEDGTANVTFFSIGNIGVDRLHNIILRYNYDGVNLSADGNIHVDENAPGVSAVLRGPPFNSTADFQIGSEESADFSMWDGQLGECSIWEGDIGEVSANKWRSPHFPATKHGDGFFVHTCSQSASPATCSTEICRDGTPNACQAEGTGSQAIFGPRTELAPNNGFNQGSGDDSAFDFNNWAESGSSTAYRADTKHGALALRIKQTATTTLTVSDCIPVSPSTDYFFEISTKKFSGAANLRIEYDPWTSADCTTGGGGTITAVNPGDLSETWETYGEAAATAAGINSLKIRIRNVNSTADILIDNVSLKAASYHTPWFENPAAGSTSSTAEDLRLDNPLARWSDPEQAYGWENGFCLGIWMNTGWSADGGFHYLFTIPTTGGTDNIVTAYKFTDDKLYFEVFDSAGATKYWASNGAITSTTWTEGWKYTEFCSDNAGTIDARWHNIDNSTWYYFSAGPSGGGTGIQDGQSDEFQIGQSNGANFLDGYIPEIHLSPYPTGTFIWPQKGWNSGNPPVNGRPY